MIEPGVPLLTPFLAARDLGKKNPDLKGNDQGEECSECGAVKDPRMGRDKKART